MTGRGIAVSGAAVALLIAGFCLRNGEWITMGTCGLLVVGSCFVLAPLNLQNLELKVQLPPRFFAGRSVHAEVELLNRRRFLDAWCIEISLRFPHEVRHTGHATWTTAGGRSVMKTRLRIPDRASFPEVACEWFSRFPMGLFEVRRTSVSNCPTVVYPRLITPAELQWDGFQPDLNALVGASTGDLFGEPRGIRPYQPGDKAARIHQFASARAMARGLGLQVRAFDPPGLHPDACRIVFHSHAKAGKIIRSDRFERALSLAAGTLAHFQNHQAKVSFHADFANWRHYPCESRVQYFDCLALLTQAKRARQTMAHELAEILNQAPPHQQLIIISDSPPEHWADLIPATQQRAILIDIRQVRFEQRQLNLQPVQRQ